MPAHDALLLAVPVALLLGVALVVLLLAAREAEIDLDPVLLPVERERNQRIALALDRADELVDLGAIQQELARTAIVGGCIALAGSFSSSWRQWAWWRVLTGG